jgi:hypothetical protein
MAELDDTDRDALLLRYFKNHDLRTVGAALGISDDAAQKRVSRAVERLRELFGKRGVSIGATGLAIAISANAGLGRTRRNRRRDISGRAGGRLGDNRHFDPFENYEHN